MNERNIDRRFRQLKFDFSVGGGGGIKSIHGNNIISLENIFGGWKKFSRGKHRNADVMVFERNLEENLLSLREDLASGYYRHGPYQPFTIHDPKKRRIHKAAVRDRVVHQAVVNIIEPAFEHRFLFDSFSCRIDKGTHAAVWRLRRFLRQASGNHTKTIYAIKCDVRKFFDSVDHEILSKLISRCIDDPRIMQLIKEIIASFSTSDRKGIPLGNVTSQLFANTYLHELDHFVKFTLRERYYVRYCDDFVIVHSSREYLLALVARIERFLDTQLSLQLHSDKVSVRTWNQGIDFLGYVVLPHCIVLRPKTRERMLQRVSTANISSYLGLCSHAASYNIQQILKNKVGRV
ncbi:MAG: reverse transcriptase/maturase family protein [Patescibacteria group bacterium]